LEVKLLIRIADFLLQRERDEKAVPNFIDQIVSKADAKLGEELRSTLYSEDEQCARVLARALGQPYPLKSVSDVALNDEYEKALVTWCPEHPFLDDTRVRNAVFEAVAVARCAISTIPEYQRLAYEYTETNRPTYHLLYIMAQLAATREVSIRFFNMLIQSCSDFVGTAHELEIEVNGLSWDEADLPPQSSVELEIVVAIPAANRERRFAFRAMVSSNDVMPLGPFLANTSVTLPCEVSLQGVPALDCAGSCEIVARRVEIDTPDLVVRGIPRANQVTGRGDTELLFDVNEATGHATAVTIKAGTIQIDCIEHALTYPLAQYVQKSARVPPSPEIAEKFRRLRRIMQEFASHGKGGLAKYRDKIEHERVLRGRTGESVLAQLLKEHVLYADAKFYHIDSDKRSEVLGTTWQELRQQRISDSVEAFLRGVP
jgi:hypothetical protein